MSEKGFHVSAGKYDDQERNCKYCDSFATLDEALEAFKKISSYPWSEIEYKGWVIDAYQK